jgi:hypothetical protein
MSSAGRRTKFDKIYIAALSLLKDTLVTSYVNEDVTLSM